jgi:hypothetical protein
MAAGVGDYVVVVEVGVVGREPVKRLGLEY